MDRRKFIYGLGAGLLTLGLGGCNTKAPGTNVETGGNSGGTQETKGTQTAAPVAAKGYDRTKLVIAQGTDPNALIEKGFLALGGISQLVKKGTSVVIKPNFSVSRKPEEAATTNPHLVAALVKQCLAAGAKQVKVVDYPFGGPLCLTTSGIKAAVEAAGGQAFNINSQSFYTEVSMGGTILQKVLFSKDVLNADILINFPILKHHMMTKVTMSLKNMMGLVWDRGYFHRTDLNQAIAELNAYRKPDLIILDATRGIIDHGPTGPGTIREWNQVVFGVDSVAVDAYGATLFGLKPTEIEYLSAAAKLGVGEIDTQKLTLVKV